MLSKSTHRLYFLKQLSCAGVPQTQLRHFYLTVIRPVLEYAAPVWHHLITKTQADHWSHTKESHPYHLYMHTRYALWKCHICSRASHYLRLQGSTVQNFFSISLYSLLPLYTIFFLPLETNYPSLAYEQPQNSPVSPTRTKKYQSFLSYALAHYQT